MRSRLTRTLRTVQRAQGVLRPSGALFRTTINSGKTAASANTNATAAPRTMLRSAAARYFHGGIAHRAVTDILPNSHYHCGTAPKVPRILVTGGVGQIGSELVGNLRKRYGVDSVIASDVKPPSDEFPTGPFVFLDVEDYQSVVRTVFDYRITWVVHLASMLSATGERNPQAAMKLNTRGIEHVLECARLYNLRVFSPSTIAVFGPTTPRDNTPDTTIMRPTTMYGCTKVYLELLGEYYHKKFGVDFRSLRYPGIISHAAMPGGGTTDYAVEIYHEAIKRGAYSCFLRSDTRMPMLYMPDCLAASIQLLECDQSRLSGAVSRVYNVTAMAFTPEEQARSIAKFIPGFAIDYKPDFRQAIADSWPASLDDSRARADWGWAPKYDLDAMTHDMLANLAPKYGKHFKPSFNPYGNTAPGASPRAP